MKSSTRVASSLTLAYAAPGQPRPRAVTGTTGTMARAFLYDAAGNQLGSGHHAAHAFDADVTEPGFIQIQWLVLVAVALVILMGGIFALYWRDHRQEQDWSLSVTNERDTGLVVAGVRGPMNVANGYAFVEPNTTMMAHFGDNEEPPDAVIIDFDSHEDANGKLIVVPAWKAIHKAIVCTWDVLKGRQIRVTDRSTSCADIIT